MIVVEPDAITLSGLVQTPDSQLTLLATSRRDGAERTMSNDRLLEARELADEITDATGVKAHPLPLHVGDGPADQNLPEGLNGLFLTGRGGQSGRRFEGGWVVQQILGAEHVESLT